MGEKIEKRRKTEKVGREKNEKPILESVEKPTIAVTPKRTRETTKKIINGVEYTCTYQYNTDARKTCEDVLKEKFIKYLQDNNIVLTD
jgi:GTP cyclohydrolase I